MSNFLEILSNYFYELQIPEKYISNYSQIFHKFQNKFSQIVVGPTSPTLSLAFCRLRTSLPFRQMRTQTESGEEAATVIRPGGGPPRQPPCSRPSALLVVLLIAGRRPSSSPATGPAPRPPWPGPRALRLALADCACLACSSGAPPASRPCKIRWPKNQLIGEAKSTG